MITITAKNITSNCSAFSQRQFNADIYHKSIRAGETILALNRMASIVLKEIM